LVKDREGEKGVREQEKHLSRRREASQECSEQLSQNSQHLGIATGCLKLGSSTKVTSQSTLSSQKSR